MKNHCRVAVFIRQSINAFKLQSLLDVTGMKERQLAAITEEELERVLAKPIDYAETDRRIGQLAHESGKYLKNALERAAHGEYQQDN